MLDETSERSRSHGIPRALIEAQARALDLPIAMASAGWEAYEETFRAALRALRTTRQITDVFFGDIDLDAHRAWKSSSAPPRGCARSYLSGRSAARRPYGPLELGYRARVRVGTASAVRRQAAR